MTDLKNVDEAALRARLSEATGHALVTVQRAATDACEQVALAARALAALPKHSNELLTTAKWVGAAEVDVRFDARWVTGFIGFDGQGDFRIGPDGEMRPPFPAGKYRALLFLVPIEEKR